MKYILLTITFLLCIFHTSKAQTLTDITTNSDQMETIRANGFNWANPSQSTNARRGGLEKCGEPGCPICYSGGGGGGGGWETYSFNWQWQSYLNSFPFPYIGPGTTKAIYLIGENGLGGGAMGYPADPSTYPYWLNIPSPNPPPTTMQTQDSTRIKTDTTKKEKPYYITVDDDTTRYYNDSTILLFKSAKPFKLTIHKDSTTLDPSNYKWKKNSTSIMAAGIDSCKHPRNIVSFFDLAIEDANKLIEVHIIILEPPFIVFNKKANFNWEYGWDEDSKNYGLLREDFNREPYGNRYYPKWMSVFHQKTVEVKVDVNNLNSSLKKIKGTLVEIKSNNPKIKINNSASLKLDYNALNTIKTINITSDELGSTIDNHLKDSILSVTNNNETIGKLYISCEKPITKKVVIVYVKSTSGGSYPNNINSQLQTFFNNKSYNQLLRQIEINPTVNGYSYPTEMDLSNVPNISILSKQDNYIHTLLRNEYQKLFMLDSTGLTDSTRTINFSTINPNESGIDDDLTASVTPNIKTRFIYITDFFDIKDSTGKILDLKGRASEIGGSYSFITNLGQSTQTITHELGHLLNLLHCFEPTYPYISDYKLGRYSDNFMDYEDQTLSSDKRDRFLYYQWFHKSILNNGIGTHNYWIW